MDRPRRIARLTADLRIEQWVDSLTTIARKRPREPIIISDCESESDAAEYYSAESDSDSWSSSEEERPIKRPRFDYEKFQARNTRQLKFRRLDTDTPTSPRDFPQLQAFKYKHNKLRQMWQTSSEAVDDLLRQVGHRFPHRGRIHDICCGLGSLLAHLRRRRPNLRISGNDIAMDGPIGDARYMGAEVFANITAVVTNPPFAKGLLEPILDQLEKNWYANDCKFSIYILISSEKLPYIINQQRSWAMRANVLYPGRYNYVPVIAKHKRRAMHNSTVPFDSVWVEIK